MVKRDLGFSSNDEANKKHKKYKQGIFNPINKAKCLNKDQIVYRSGLEMRVMLKLDTNPHILEWGSETTIINYQKPGIDANGNVIYTPARYYVDFYIKLLLPDKSTQKYLIEVKPLKQHTLREYKGAKKSTVLYEQVQFVINKAKWDAAKEWCRRKGDYRFELMDENQILSLF